MHGQWARGKNIMILDVISLTFQLLLFNNYKFVKTQKTGNL